jgi:E3 ubiquitin-protein ligase RGLG
LPLDAYGLFSFTGKFSFHGRSLHHISNAPNPYEQAISIIGQTLSKFDEDNLIPCFGFGDATTHDQDVFCFYPDLRPCNGFSEALSRYRELVPHLRLAGKLMLPSDASYAGSILLIHTWNVVF